VSTQASEGWEEENSLEPCEGGVGLERLRKGLRSLRIKAVVVEAARKGG